MFITSASAESWVIRCSASSQHLLKLLFEGKPVYNYGHWVPDRIARDLVLDQRVCPHRSACLQQIWSEGFWLLDGLQFRVLQLTLNLIYRTLQWFLRPCFNLISAKSWGHSHKGISPLKKGFEQGLRRKGITISTTKVSELGPPIPSTASECGSPFLDPGGEPNSFHAGRGLGTQFRRLDRHSGTLRSN